MKKLSTKLAALLISCMAIGAFAADEMKKVGMAKDSMAK